MTQRTDEMSQHVSYTPVEATDEAFPCTPLQDWAVRLQRSRPTLPIANVAMRWRVNGTVRDTAFEAALQALVDRHEALRTRFDIRDGAVVQIVTTQTVRPSIVDLSRLSEEQVEQEIARISRLEAREPFDMSIAPLVRATVLRVSPKSAVLLLTLHVSIVDGWSIGVIAREFAAIAESHMAGTPLSLPDVDLQLPDYALWQQEMLRGSAVGDARAYWRRKLAGVRFFEVPHPGRERPAEHSGEGSIRSILLQPERVLKLRELADRLGHTLFAISAAALAAALGREASAREVVIATPLANRAEPLLHGLVGPTVNSVALRFDLSQVASVEKYLQQCRSTIAEAIANSSAPYELVVKDVGLEPPAGRPFALGVNYTLQAANIDTDDAGSIKAGGVELVSIPSVSVGALYDLNFFMVQRAAEGWRTSCEFNEDLYSAEEVDRLLELWQAEMLRLAEARAVDAKSAETVVAAPYVVPEPKRNYFRVVPLQPKGSRPSVFAFNNRSAYYPVAKHFGTTRPFIDIQWREDAVLPPLTADAIPEMAADAVRRVREFDPHGPYYFMGHCMMGNVAFETARQLQASGAKVLTLFLLDTLAPGYVENMPWYDKLLRRITLLDSSVKNAFVLRAMIKRGEITRREALLLYRFIRNNPLVKPFLRKGDAENPGNYGEDLMNNGLMSFLRDAKGLYKYQKHHGDVVFYRAIDARSGRLFARDFGWGKLVDGNLCVYDVPGKHLEMTREPSAKVLAEHAAWTMDKIEGRWHAGVDPLTEGR